MKLTSTQIEQTLGQFEAEPIPENHPMVPQLNEVFGERASAQYELGQCPRSRQPSTAFSGSGRTLFHTQPHSRHGSLPRRNISRKLQRPARKKMDSHLGPPR